MKEVSQSWFEVNSSRLLNTHSITMQYRDVVHFDPCETCSCANASSCSLQSYPCIMHRTSGCTSSHLDLRHGPVFSGCTSSHLDLRHGPVFSVVEEQVDIASHACRTSGSLQSWQPQHRPAWLGQATASAHEQHAKRILRQTLCQHAPPPCRPVPGVSGSALSSTTKVHSASRSCQQATY